MVQISRTRLFAAVCALGVLASASAHADEYTTNLGPVGPNEPILANVGGQRIIAFFTPERGSCAVNTIMWKDAGADTIVSRQGDFASRSDGSVRRRAPVNEPALRR
jgi:hypothetical protein